MSSTQLGEITILTDPSAEARKELKWFILARTEGLRPKILTDGS